MVNVEFFVTIPYIRSEKVKARNKFQQPSIDGAIKTLLDVSERGFYGDEMLILNKNMHFKQNARFKLLLDEIATAPVYQEMAWRLHVLIWAVENALKVPGCLVECGVFRGFKSYFLLRYFAKEISKRPFFLFDTFEGIDPNQRDGSPIQPDEHRKAFLYDFIVDRFKEFPNVQIIKGSVPDTLTRLRNAVPCFLHLDMNSWEAEIGALNFLWPRMLPGSVLVLDDFGLYSHRAQMENELKWLHGVGESVLELPTGQGLVIKK
jgi:O-methyltransferase